MVQFPGFNNLIVVTYTAHSRYSIILLQNGTKFLTEYRRYRDMSRFNLTRDDVYSQQCYDATWALAYALNGTLSDTGEIYHTLQYHYAKAYKLQVLGITDYKRLEIN